MKRSFTIVLTLAAAVSAMIGKPATAQVSNATTLIAKGYNASEVATALVPVSQKNGMTPDEQSCFDAINSLRVSNGLAPLTPDPALAASARCQVADEINNGFQGPFVYVSPNGQKQTKAMANVAVDFGSSVTGVQNYEYNNYAYSSYTGNWPLLVYIWSLLDGSFGQFTQDPSVSIGGVGLVDIGLVVGGQHIYEWSLVAGKPAPPAAPAPPPSAATIPFWRFHNPNNNEEFYTDDPGEKAAVSGYMAAEGVAGQVYANASDAVSLVALHRFYNPIADAHFWSADPNEISIVSQYMRDEGTVAYVFPAISTASGIQPMYRAYNPSTDRHLFTSSTSEYNSLSAAWNREGVVFNTK